MRQPELPAELGVLLEQRDGEAALGVRRRGAEAGRAGADDRDRRRGLRRRRASGSGSSTSSVSRQARGLTRQLARLLAKAWSRQAWLQAMQVLISSARPAAALLHEVGSASSGRASETRSAVPSATSSLGELGGVDPVGGADRDGDLLAQPPRRPGPGAARDLGDDRRDARLVPADAGVDHRGAGLLDEQGQLDDLVPGLAALDEVEQRHPVDDREAVADRLAGTADDLDREAHPAGRRTSPLVVAVVGARGEELVDQVALGAHDLDRVVPRPLREPRAVRRRPSRSGRPPWSTSRSAGTA